MSRESLYRALSNEGNPEFATILKVMNCDGAAHVCCAREACAAIGLTDTFGVCLHASVRSTMSRTSADRFGAAAIVTSASRALS